ncbi:MAG TPA: hypothetical protein VK422_18900 [Pyrinomonadaceae bacterium]|nr:hypothetical protein [Pyrinomonadaceae bacterium]
MARVTVTVQLQSPLLRDPQSLRPALEGAVRETALDIERDIKEAMRRPKGGRTYARGVITRRASKTTRGLGLREIVRNRGQLTPEGFSRERRVAVVGSRIHRASAPGEAPAVDLGELANSYSTTINGLRASVGSPLEKAALLEGGTRMIAPRPAAGPAAERAREPFTRRVDEAVRRLC